MAAAPSLPRTKPLFFMGVPAGGGGGSNSGKLSGKKPAAENPGWNALMYFQNLFFHFLPPLLPPGANQKKPLGFSGGRMGDAGGGGLPLKDIIENNIYKFI